jgi:hypothetical protein
MSYDIDPFDTTVDTVIDGLRPQCIPVWQIFAAVNGWSVAETDYCGRFVVRVFECEQLAEAMGMCRLLNRAESLRMT